VDLFPDKYSKDRIQAILALEKDDLFQEKEIVCEIYEYFLKSFLKQNKTLSINKKTFYEVCNIDGEYISSEECVDEIFKIMEGEGKWGSKDSNLNPTSEEALLSSLSSLQGLGSLAFSITDWASSGMLSSLVGGEGGGGREGEEEEDIFDVGMMKELIDSIINTISSSPSHLQHGSIITLTTPSERYDDIPIFPIHSLLSSPLPPSDHLLILQLMSSNHQGELSQDGTSLLLHHPPSPQHQEPEKYQQGLLNLYSTSKLSVILFLFI